MRVLAACSLGGAGHLNPLLPILRAAQARGDDVVLIAPPAMRSMVDRTGLPFWSGGEPSEAEIAPLRELLASLPGDEASALGSRELFGRLATTAMLPEMERAIGEWMPDLVVREPCEYASAAVGGRAGLPVIQVAISSSRAEAACIELAAPALEEFRSGLTGELRQSPYLTAFPQSLDPSSFPTTIRYRTVDAAPRPVHPRAETAVPLIYMTFGTVLPYMSIASTVYRAALSAVADLPARILLSIGDHLDPAVLGAVPSNTRVAKWVDHDEVFRDASLVVCHGGSGTVFGALAAGVPLVVVPSFADQFDNGRKVTRAGAGEVVVARTDGLEGARRPVDLDDGPRITAAIERVASSRSYRDAAGRIADEMASSPSAAGALAAVEAMLAR